MINIKCTYSNGETINTRINGTIETASEYYLNQWFNIGSVEDNMQQCLKIELV